MLFTLPLSTLTIFFVLVYVVDFSSNYHWKTNTTISLVVEAIINIERFKSLLPIPLSIVSGIILFLFLSLSVFYYKNIDALTQARVKLWSDQRLRRGCAAIAGGAAAFFCLSGELKTAWEGEPITDLFRPYVMITKNNMHSNISAPSLEFSSSGEGGGERPNVILIIVDALRPDHVGGYGYSRNTTPYIDSLLSSGRAVKVNKAFSTCAESYCGIVSTLSSRPYFELDTKNINLNSVLKSSGYTVNFILSADHRWSGLEKHYPPYDLYYNGGMTSAEYIATDDRLVIDKLKTIEDFSSPTFFYFHLMSTHVASPRPEKFALFRPYTTQERWYYNLPGFSLFYPEVQDSRINYYDNGVVASDYRVKEVISLLEKKGYMENSVVWIISDHGDALGERGKYGHILNLYQNQISIPMIIVDPEIERYKELRVASQLDVAPTILDRLGIDIPETWKGESLLKRRVGRTVTFHAVPSRDKKEGAVIYEENNYMYKAIFTREPLVLLEIYDLLKDEGEQDNLLHRTGQGNLKKMVFKEISTRLGEI